MYTQEHVYTSTTEQIKALIRINIYFKYVNFIPIYIQQDATLQCLFYMEIALHVLGGISTHHRERKQLYL
jgi:hypothetical protein